MATYTFRLKPGVQELRLLKPLANGTRLLSAGVEYTTTSFEDVKRLQVSKQIDLDSPQSTKAVVVEDVKTEPTVADEPAPTRRRGNVEKE